MLLNCSFLACRSFGDCGASAIGGHRQAENLVEYRRTRTQLDPELDLWKTAKPFLERWMNEQVGWRGLIKNLQAEAPQWAALLPQMPRLAHQALNSTRFAELETEISALVRQQYKLNRWVVLLASLLTGLICISLYLAFFKAH